MKRMSAEKTKKVIDKMAAVVILEGYLQHLSLRTEDNMMAEQKEPIIISVSDPGGIERDYVQDVVIPLQERICCFGFYSGRRGRM